VQSRNGIGICKLPMRKIFAVLLVVVSLVTGRLTKAKAADLDVYGGTPGLQCRKGKAAHFYTEKGGNRWWLCDPLGNGFFLKGVYDVSPNVNNAQDSFIQSKYAGPLSNWMANWALEQARRLQLWGFNTMAEYGQAELLPGAVDPAWNPINSNNTIPIKLAFAGNEMTSHDAFQNVNGCNIASPVKDMMNGVGSVYSGYHYNFGDYFDPNFNICVGNVLKNDQYGLQLWLNSANSPYMVYITIDESDETGLLDRGPDFESIGGDQGLVGSGPASAPHPAWIALVTAPTQTSNSSQGVTYSNTAVYTKQELSTWLAARYNNNIASLNAAWGSNYTTFGASGAGWGVGTGLMDENGACPSKTASQSCWVGDPSKLSGETAAMQADMSAFLVLYLDQYYSVETTQFRSYAPGYLLQMQIGGWGAPPRKEVLTETAKYIDLPILSAVPAGPCVNCTDEQARIDFVAEYLGDRPWINWLGFWALPDSAESAYATDTPEFPTQNARGVGYQNMINSYISARTTAYGSYPVVGFDWWGLYDMDSQQANWGLATPHDNPYDGCSATIVGCGNDQWGYPTGGEKRKEGSFVALVSATNNGVYQKLIGDRLAPRE
jgi:hypothetical protein